MVRAVWVFSSVLLVSVILAVLPLGLSKSGKALAAFSAFLLAMAGLVATVSFPFWLTFVLLFLLAFSIAYLFDSRLHQVVYKKSNRFEGSGFFEEDQKPLLVEVEERNESEQFPDLAPISFGFDHSIAELDLKDDLEDDLAQMLRNQYVKEEEAVKMSELETNYLADIEELLAARAESGIDSLDKEQSDSVFKQKSEIPLVTVDSDGGK